TVAIALLSDGCGRHDVDPLVEEDECDVLRRRCEARVLRIAETRPRGEPVGMDDDVVDRGVRRVPLGIERAPQVVRTEAVRPDVDEEIGAVRGSENDVLSDKSPRTEA